VTGAGRSAPPALAVYVKLLRATDSVVAVVEPRIREAGLTLTQWGALDALFHLGPLSQAVLARKVMRSAGNMTTVLDGLEARGLVRRGRDPTDRRMLRIELTEEGEGLFRRLFPDHASDIARAMDALPLASLQRLETLLRRLGHGAASHAQESGEP